MITPSFSLTATERVLPKLALDFTTANLDPRVTFTRTGNTATVVNSSGYVVGINADLPRFDYNPVTLVCKGLLIEESRTNSLLYSEDFTQIGSWARFRLNTVSADATTSPSNTATADKLVEDATATNTHGINQTAGTVGATETFSVFAKASERSWIYLQLGNAHFAYFNLTTGAVGTTGGSGVVAICTNYGNNWWRCSVTGVRATSQINTILMATNNGGITYSGDNASGLFIWGAQIEAGAFPTSYIPTVASTVTRNADIATMTGTNFSDWYNTSQGSVAVTFDTFQALTANQRVILIDGSARIIDMYMTSATVISSFNGTNSINATSSFALNTPIKVCAAYQTGNYALVANANTVATNADVTVNTGAVMYLGRYSSNSNYLNGHLAKISYYSNRLTNATLQAFSK